MTAKAKEKGTEVVIQAVQTGVLDVHVLGTQPLILNRMSEKAWRELLLPAPPKNRASKAATLKHMPIEEYRASVYRSKHAGDETALLLPVQCFKNAALTAALDTPGSSKAQMGRLLWVRERFVPIYGVPQLSMMIVRMANAAKTPDVRTRAILPQWAARFTIEYVRPMLSAGSVMNLLAAGGLIAGVGDFRQEKGKGSFGQFVIVDPDDARYAEVVANGKRDAQLAALEAPECYDEETAELLSWYDEELARRSSSAAEPTPRAKARRKGNGAEQPRLDA